MAKRKVKEVIDLLDAESEKAADQVIEQPKENKLETTKKANIVANKRTSTIELRNPADKLVLRTKNKKNVRLTIEEALKEKNFRRLTKSSQMAITNGKSASQIVREQEEQE